MPRHQYTLIKTAYFSKFASIITIALFTGLTALHASQEIIKAHGISVFGDLKYQEGFQHFDYVNPNAPKGGEISIWAYGSYDSMNPYSRKGSSGALSSIFFESLLEGNSDEVSAAYGLLAESIEYASDRSWIIFNIRPEARFSDGSMVTAADVNFSYELFLSEGLTSFRAELGKSVEHVEIINPYKIKFVFNTDEPTRDYPLLVGSIPVFSKNWFENTKSKLDESRLEPAIGSGPYILDTLDVGKRLIYRFNPDYWGNDLSINQGRNNFETIRIEYFADPSAAFEAFKSGIYSFRIENQSKLWATGYDFPTIENGWVKKSQLPDGSVASGQNFIFNLRREKFQDIRVREAIGLMFNFEWTNATLFYNLYKRINSVWENSYLEATDMPGIEELVLLESVREYIPKTVFTEPAVMAPVSGTRLLDRNNLLKASNLLDDAGWYIEDGLRFNEAGVPLKIEFLINSVTFERIINPYIENLKKLGIDAIITRVDSSQYTERTRNHDFDIVTSSFGFGYEPGGVLRQRLGTEYVDGVFNMSGLANKGVDTLINYVLASKTQDELTIAVKALDRTLRSLRFFVPQWYRDFHTVAFFDYYQYPEKLPPYSLGFLDFWWVNQERFDELKKIGAF